MKSLNELAGKPSVLGALDGNFMIGFQGGQLEEERRKARIILNEPDSSDWEAGFIQAELHPVFHGQIGILLEGNLDDNCGPCFSHFNQSFQVVKALLDNEGSRIGKAHYLLPRAVLAKSEPIQLGSQERIEFSGSIFNWRTLLDRGDGWSGFRLGFQRLIHSLIDSRNYEICMIEMLRVSRPLEPWMSAIIRDGEALFECSNTKKIQCYYDNGVFLYSQTNATEGDILLGPIAGLRNRLIAGLLDKPEGEWEILNDDNIWHRVDIGQKDRAYFKGHRITMIQKTKHDEAGWCCDFGYQKLVISGPDSPDIEVKFPETGDLGEFRQNLEQKSQSASDGLDLILKDLSDVC